jgi:hypothetical protein
MPAALAEETAVARTINRREIVHDVRKVLLDERLPRETSQESSPI